MKIKEVGRERLVSNFIEHKIGYRAIYKGVVEVDGKAIEYRRYSNITDVKGKEIYLTDDINILTDVNDEVREELEHYLTN